ncbi:hypothetical protein [Rhodoflexus sp.]
MRKLLLYRYLFAGIVIAYMVAYTPYSYDDADAGFIQALAWRISNGEVPHRDFIYIMPALSPLLQVFVFLIIPENYQILTGKLLCYLLFAASALLGALSIDQLSPKRLIDPFLLATIGFVYSVACFSPKPWYTVDAVFFSAAGCYLLIVSSFTYAPIGLLLLVCAALCKQPFYLMPLAGIVLVAFRYQNLFRIVFALCLTVLYIGIFLWILHQNEAFEDLSDRQPAAPK